jgi:hypothetical protein
MIVVVISRREKSPASSFEDDPRWLLVQRIAASSSFVSSPRLSTFLLYVSKQCLVGASGSLNERSIGEVVFERSPGYDPRDDNIVRSHASRLRIRLQEYFEGEGASEELRVNIPRGSYVPLFEQADSGLQATALQVSPSESALPEQDADAAQIAHRLWPWDSKTLAICLVLLAAAIATALTFAYHRFRLANQETPTHKLWSQMFRSDQQTIIAPADSSLVIATMMVGHQIPLDQYAGGLYRQATVCVEPCDSRTVHHIEGARYTSMSDLEFAVKVTHLPEAILNRTEIRYVRDLELKDFKESNLILAGSQEADPWLSAISGKMNFVVHDDPTAGALRVENRQPKAGEENEYLYDPHDPQHRGLATIAFLPNLTGSGNLLVVQGFSVAGTQAAAEFITDGRDLDVLFPSYAGNTSKLPHFEILLATVEVNGMASRPVPLAWHIYP